MTRTGKRTEVFVSSTSEDLKEYRAVARLVILDLGWHPNMMEHFGARPGTTVDECRALVDQSDVMLLIVGFRQGWVPTDAQGGNGRDSITCFEYQQACAKGIPVLALLASDKTWPYGLGEDDPTAREWMKRFRCDLDRIADYFDYEAPSARESAGLPGFRALVTKTLVAQKERFLNGDDGAETEVAGPDWCARAAQGLIEGTDIPVLGCGIYGNGPLSSKALASALLADAGLDRSAQEELSLATAAEYRERFDRARSKFLGHFRQILDEQAARVSSTPLLDFLAEREGTPVIVSTTYDRLLESKFKRKYVVIAHILRSYKNQHDGKLLVLRPGSDPEMCLTSQFSARPGECVIYKLQGFPLRDDEVDPDLEIDTLVATETDYAVFLQLLAKPDSGLPSKLGGRFRRSPLLFLGYTMHLWQYRLIMQVFESAGREGGSTLAVRIPETPIEEVAWGRLKADLARIEPAEFAKRLAERAGSSRGMGAGG